MSAMKDNAPKARGVMIKDVPVTVATEERSLFTNEESVHMSKKLSAKLESTKKWLGKTAQASLNIKPAEAALANAEKAAAELDSLRTKVAAMAETKKNAVKTLDAAIEKIKIEKKLKAQEAKVQAKLASLSSPPGTT
jgi:DNA repair ATPase RecN